MRFSSRFIISVTLSLLVISAVGLGLLVSSRGAAHAAGARIQLSQKSGPPTTVVTVSGFGFGDNEPISIYFNTKALITTTSSSTGSFSTHMQIPVTAKPGVYEVKAIGQSSGLIALNTFRVQTDWPQLGFDAHHRGFNPYENMLNSTNVSGLTVGWNYNWNYGNCSGNVSSPTVVNGVVYIGSMSYCFGDYKVYALDSKTGTLKWSYPTGGDVSTPAVFNGLVYIGSDKLYVLDAATGLLKWSYSTGGSIFTPTVANGLVYVGSADHKLYALEATTGVLKWSYTIAEGISSPLTVTKNMVYAGSSAAKLYALDALMGKLKWSYSIKNSAPISAAPVADNGLVYVGAHGYNTNLYALNAATGTFKWSYSVGECGIESAPSVANGVIYIGSNEGADNYEMGGCDNNTNLYALDAITGASIWSTFVGDYSEGTHNSSPTIANGVLYVTSNDYNHTEGGYYWTEYAIDIKTHAILWQYGDFKNQFGGLAASPAIVINGVVYVGSMGMDNTLYTFHLPGTTS